MTTIKPSASSDKVQYIHGDDHFDDYFDDYVDDHGVEERDKLLQAYLEYVQARRDRDREPLLAATPHSARM